MELLNSHFKQITSAIFAGLLCVKRNAQTWEQRYFCIADMRQTQSEGFLRLCLTRT
jgi:hypothetical protein